MKVPLCAVSKVDARLNLYSNYPEKGTGKNEKTHDIRFDPALSGSMAFAMEDDLLWESSIISPSCAATKQHTGCNWQSEMRGFSI
ncbi:MAG: hypothetical protein F4X24_03600 [Rhodobacteraceae bacterium]|nr:hypothetical protein [Paracoccaceae bacterium]